MCADSSLGGGPSESRPSTPGSLLDEALAAKDRELAALRQRMDAIEREAQALRRRTRTPERHIDWRNA